MVDELTSERRLAGNRLKAFRADRGWKQADLAKRMGVSVGTINRWEKGKTGIEDTNLQKLAGLLAVRPGALMEDETLLEKEKRAEMREGDVDIESVVQVWVTETNNMATQVMDSLRAAAEFVTHAVDAMERFRDRTRALEEDLDERLKDRTKVPELAALQTLLKRTARFTEDRLADRSLEISRQEVAPKQEEGPSEGGPSD